jgi:16S rRNA (guanine(1405)-N(7))-methyltransferase
MPNALVEKEAALEQVVQAVRASAKYRAVDESFVRRVASLELGKRKDWKEAVKATKNKLHQVGGAYQDPGGMEYRRWLGELEKIDVRQEPEALRELCRRMMGRHASTRERLAALDDFYRAALGPLGPIHSVLDLACGKGAVSIAIAKALGFSVRALTSSRNL